MHFIVLLNPSAGTRSKKAFLTELAYHCLERNWTYELRLTWYINEKKNVEKILQEKPSAIIICGGDGTINRVFKAFWEQKALHKVQFYIYPGGTFNSLSKVTQTVPETFSEFPEQIRNRKTQEIDLLEIHFQKGEKEYSSILQSGALLAKDSSFTKHAAQIKKALHQKDLALGFQSFKGGLPYLKSIPHFTYAIGKDFQKAQAIYIANNPYLITNQPINPDIKMDDGKFSLIFFRDTNPIQLTQAAAVVLLGLRRELDYLKVEPRKEWSIALQESIHMNLDGDITEIPKGTEINITVSSQKVHLICV